MKKNVIVPALSATFALIGIAAWLGASSANSRGTTVANASEKRQTPTPPEPLTEKVRRGEHLVTVAACNDCHTPWKMGDSGPEPDFSRRLSGHPAEFVVPPPPPASPPWIASTAATNTAWAGPWGVSFTANLTPDEKTGLGTWTEQNFVRAIRTGRHMGQGRPILPPMPVEMYKHFTDDELGAIFAYLQSLPAIENQVPSPRPPEHG